MCHVHAEISKYKMQRSDLIFVGCLKFVGLIPPPVCVGNESPAGSYPHIKRLKVARP